MYPNSVLFNAPDTIIGMCNGHFQFKQSDCQIGLEN